MRLLLRVLAPLLALLLAVAGLALVVETVTAWVAPASSPLVVPWPAWRAAIEGLTWQSGSVRVVAIVVGVIGLFVLILGLVVVLPLLTALVVGLFARARLPLATRLT